MNDVVAMPTRFLEVTLHVSDPEVIHELERREDDGTREAFAADALRLGVLALRQANGSLDADTIRREGQRLLASVDSAMQQRSAELTSSVSRTVQQFLDPATGVLPQRLDRLTKPNGDLDALLGKHLSGDQSVIAKTLARHLGEHSPIFKLLSPKESDGLLAALSETVENALEAQREALLEQFSLDHEGSALQRLSAMLAETSEAVESSLTLDDDASPLARLKRELLDVLTQHKQANAGFQAEVRSTLETFKTRREEAARSPRHGVTFEDQLGEQLEQEATRTGDICDHVAAVNGRLQRKLGDYLVELGPESASPGARVVFEAKAMKRSTVKNALSELGEARKNRDAQVGVFVFDRASAPEHMDSLHRVGSDILVVWDADDPATDIFLHAAYGLARTLAHRISAADANADADFAAIDDLLDSLASQVSALDSIDKSARTVERNGKTILTTAQTMRDALEFQVHALRGRIDGLRPATSEE